MTIKLFQVDAFTDTAYKGNPAAVCLLDQAKADGWMQNVAAEMNLSETAFLLPKEDGYELRWFTPTVEEVLCGHATLASAHILWEYGYLKESEQARFTTLSGLLTAAKKGIWTELDFPIEPETPTDELPDKLIDGLGVTPIYLGKNRLDYLVEVASEEIVRKIKPDFDLLSKIPGRGFIVTSRANSKDYDFVSRFFAPKDGVIEDPVTGSAHCCLGPFWGNRLGKKDMVGYQVSSRGGTVHVTVCGNRIHLSGQAVTILRGELLSY